MKNFSRSLWGVVFVVIGLVIGLNSFGITDIDLFFDGWWTLFIIVPCFISLFNPENGGKMGDIIGLFIGFSLLLISRGVFDYGVIAKLVVPFIFVLIGIHLLFNNTIKAKISEKVREGKKNGLEVIAATFSEQRVNKDNEKFEGANLESVFGNIVFDLRKSKPVTEMVIDASAIFGGIEIIVPNDVNVKVKSTAIFGGVSNHISNSENAEYTIYIDAFTMFGGIDIK